MAKKISASVGKGGKNKPADVIAVQEMLNGFAKKSGFKKLDVDGLIGPKTNAAIAAFQKNSVGMARPDSRVDPSGNSMKTLSMGPKKAEAEAKKAEKAGAESGAKKNGAKGDEKGKQAEGTGKGKPQVKGDTRGVDKRLLGVLEAVSAHYGKPIVVETGKQSSDGGSSDANQLWQDWVGKVNRGMGHATLRKKGKLRKDLDDLYQHTKFDKFKKLVDQNLKKGGKKSSADDAHAKGRAVDIKKNTDQKVLAALATMLRKEDEEGVIHFDDAGKSLPKTITEAMKKKWA